MRLKGQEIKGPNEGVIVIPRPGEDLVFKCRAILDYSNFEKYCPQPKPPKIRKRGVAGLVEDIEDKGFKAEVESFARKQVAFVIIESLRLGSPDLEWETVQFPNSDTWINYKTEMKDAGFTPREIIHLENKILEINSLTETVLEEARERFLAIQSLEAQSNGISHEGGLLTTLSGEPVSVSPSPHLE